ncbi:anthranilate phosphoribosyltransferase [candidate division NPL-UPA2 bacterium]|nr:anthranilate phosphoribosyltransferase [candidate division NPL-UPA2 bacterium]
MPTRQSRIKGNAEGENSSFFDELLSQYRKEWGGEKGNLEPYIEKVRRKEKLKPYEAYGAMRILMSEGPSDSQRAAFLTALNAKGESIAEIAAFVFAIREMAEPVRVKLQEGRDAVIGDTCGTGGGTLDTFNISTTIMFILAASGMVIAKHGNRAITSKCGSADVLEKLGVRIDLKPSEVEDCISKIGIGFLYAPNFHRAFKNVQKVRKQIGVPTVFNILGPLANPAFDSRKKNGVQLLGVREPRLTRRMAEVLKLLNMKRAFVVHGFDKTRKRGMDELSTLGENVISELCEDGQIKDFKILPGELGFKPPRGEDLAGGTGEENSRILIDILKGKEKRAKRDIVLLNAAAGLLLGNKAKSLQEGIEAAAQLIDTGQAYEKLEQLRGFRP